MVEDICRTGFQTCFTKDSIASTNKHFVYIFLCTYIYIYVHIYLYILYEVFISRGYTSFCKNRFENRFYKYPLPYIYILQTMYDDDNISNVIS